MCGAIWSCARFVEKVRRKSCSTQPVTSESLSDLVLLASPVADNERRAFGKLTGARQERYRVLTVVFGDGLRDGERTGGKPVGPQLGDLAAALAGQGAQTDHDTEIV